MTGLYRVPQGWLKPKPDHCLARRMVGMLGWVNGQMVEHLRHEFLTPGATTHLTPEADRNTGHRMDRWGGGASGSSWELSSVGSSDPISLAGIVGLTIVADVAYGASASANYPRIIDKSTAGSSANGYGLILSKPASPDAILFQSAGNASATVTDVRLQSAFDTTIAVRTQNNQAYEYFLGRESLGSASTVSALTIPSATATLSVGNANHANQQWHGLIRRLWIWARYLPDPELQIALDRRRCWEVARRRPRLYAVPSGGGGGGSIAPLAYHHRQMMRAA